MSPKIAPLNISDAPADIKALLGTENKSNFMWTLARHHKLFLHWMRFVGQLVSGGTIQARERELLILRTAALCGCDYSWSHHVQSGLTAGLTEAEIAQLRAGYSLQSWNPRDAILVRTAEQLVVKHRIDDGTWAELSQLFSDEQLIELMMLVGQYVMIAGVLNSIEVEMDPSVY